LTEQPPSWPPYYFSGGWFRLDSDEPQFKVKDGGGFEFTKNEDSEDPVLSAHFYAEDFAREFACAPKWLLTGGWTVIPGKIKQQHNIHGVAFIASKTGSDRTVEGVVQFSADRSNWVRVDVLLGHFRVFTGWFDRVYEEFELWPSRAEKSDEAPGTIGKRKNWVNLSAQGWPAIRNVLGHEFLHVELPDD